MKSSTLIRIVQCVCLLALTPLVTLGGPWDPNRARPPGFQRTLAYLENNLYDYPLGELRSARNSILHDDLVSGIITNLKNSGQPPSSWEALGQQTYDAYLGQYNQLKTIIRQTMSNAEGIIQTVEGNQPLPADLVGHVNVKALILLKWQLLNIAEQTYQAVLYAQGGAGSTRPPTGIPNPNPPKPGKSNELDYERMRRSREAANKRQQELEAQRAREAARRWAEINELIRRLLANEAQSGNKFKWSRPGSAVPVAPVEEPGPTEPADGIPTPAAPAAADPGLEPEQEKTDEPSPSEEPKKLVKIKIYQGTFTLTRFAGLLDADWAKLRDAVLAEMGKTPGVTGLDDGGDVLTWKYKGKIPGDKLMDLSPPVFTYTPGETIEEEVAEDGTTTPPAKPEKSASGNGDADPEGLEGKLVPGTERRPAKPAPKSTPARPESAAPSSATPGYWYDPTDREAKGGDPIIYVRVDGVATRVPLSEAAEYGVPPDASIDTMTHYSERQKKVLIDRGTHRSKDQPRSTNKFAKPKG